MKEVSDVDMPVPVKELPGGEVGTCRDPRCVWSVEEKQDRSVAKLSE